MDIIGNSNYLIYEDGRVQNKKTKKYLKHHINTNAYFRISLWKNNKETRTYLHRLLALHFIPNPHNYPHIDHIDRNPKNNSLSNLRWVTHSMNMRNTKMRCDNTSGHKNIYYASDRDRWLFRSLKTYKYFKTKTDALCYKYIYLLKMKVKKNIT